MSFKIKKTNLRAFYHDSYISDKQGTWYRLDYDDVNSEYDVYIQGVGGEFTTLHTRLTYKSVRAGVLEWGWKIQKEKPQLENDSGEK